MNGHLAGQQVYARLLGDHVDVLAMPGELLDPAGEEPENWVVAVNCLRNDEEPHAGMIHFNG